MGYKSSRSIAWIERVTNKVIRTSDGAERLSRWLILGYILTCLSFAYFGLGMAIYGSDAGSLVAMIGMMFGLLIPLSLHTRIHFGHDGDEREKLIAWRAFSVSGMSVGLLLVIWMCANGAFDDTRLWMPDTKYEWRALAFASLASMQGFATIAITWLQPPYLAEPDEEFEF